MKKISWVFDQVERKAPRPHSGYLVRDAQDGQRYDNAIQRACYEALRADGESATIRRKDRAEAGLSDIELLDVPSSLLRLGLLRTFDHRLRALHEWDGSTILLPDNVAADAVRRALAVLDAGLQSGRPEHPAKAWYAARGFDRGGATIRELQDEMRNTLGVEPPKDRTIRKWEDANRNKPPE